MSGGRRAVFAAVLAIGAAAVVVAAVTRPTDAAAHASSLDQLVAQAQTAFGDGHIAGAEVHGSRLDVVLAVRPSTNGAALLKSQFEAQLLAATVADWMRSNGEEPFRTVGYRNLRGDRIGFGRGLEAAVPSDSGLSSLGPGTCESLAKASVHYGFTLASVRTLPYLHGTCVVRFRTWNPAYTSNAVAAAFVHLNLTHDAANEHPRFFELDDRSGRPVNAFSSMPGQIGLSAWLRKGLPDPFPHQ
jgi:hypothetical protein